MLSGRIFLSHSKNDKDIVNYFTQAFARVEITPKLMEIEDLSQRYAGVEIADIIRNECNAVAVLLGNKLLLPSYESRQYTHNWVNFEVGVAAGSGKPVWVFEGPKNIDFPIPYVTDYIRYDINSMEYLRYIGQVVKDNLLMRSYSAQSVYCPYSTCNARFYYWNSVKGTISCPVCRRQMTFGTPQQKQGTDTTFTYFPSNIR